MGSSPAPAMGGGTAPMQHFSSGPRFMQSLKLPMGKPNPMAHPQVAPPQSAQLNPQLMQQVSQAQQHNTMAKVSHLIATAPDPATTKTSSENPGMSDWQQYASLQAGFNSSKTADFAPLMPPPPQGDPSQQSGPPPAPQAPTDPGQAGLVPGVAPGTPPPDPSMGQPVPALPPVDPAIQPDPNAVGIYDSLIADGQSPVTLPQVLKYDNVVQASDGFLNTSLSKFAAAPWRPVPKPAAPTTGVPGAPIAPQPVMTTPYHEPMPSPFSPGQGLSRSLNDDSARASASNYQATRSDTAPSANSLLADHYRPSGAMPSNPWAMLQSGHGEDLRVPHNIRDDNEWQQARVGMLNAQSDYGWRNSQQLGIADQQSVGGGMQQPVSLTHTEEQAAMRQPGPVQESLSADFNKNVMPAQDRGLASQGLEAKPTPTSYWFRHDPLTGAQNVYPGQFQPSTQPRELMHDIQPGQTAPPPPAPQAARNPASGNPLFASSQLQALRGWPTRDWHENAMAGRLASSAAQMAGMDDKDPRFAGVLGNAIRQTGFDVDLNKGTFSPRELLHDQSAPEQPLPSYSSPPDVGPSSNFGLNKEKFLPKYPGLNRVADKVDQLQRSQPSPTTKSGGFMTNAYNTAKAALPGFAAVNSTNPLGMAANVVQASDGIARGLGSAFSTPTKPVAAPPPPAPAAPAMVSSPTTMPSMKHALDKLGGLGTLIGAVGGGVLGHQRGNTAEGIGRGVVRGFGTDAGMSLGALGGAGIGSLAGAGIGGLIGGPQGAATGIGVGMAAGGIGGGVLGGLGGYDLTGRMLGAPKGEDGEGHKKKPGGAHDLASQGEAGHEAPAAYKKSVDLSYLAKAAWQDNSGSQTSATTESKNLGFKHRADDYDRGPAAWHNSSKYLHAGSSHDHRIPSATKLSFDISPVTDWLGHHPMAATGIGTAAGGGLGYLAGDDEHKLKSTLLGAGLGAGAGAGSSLYGLNNMVDAAATARNKWWTTSVEEPDYLPAVDNFNAAENRLLGINALNKLGGDKLAAFDLSSIKNWIGAHPRITGTIAGGLGGAGLAYMASGDENKGRNALMGGLAGAGLGYTGGAGYDIYSKIRQHIAAQAAQTPNPAAGINTPPQDSEGAGLFPALSARSPAIMGGPISDYKPFSRDPARTAQWPTRPSLSPNSPAPGTELMHDKPGTDLYLIKLARSAFGSPSKPGDRLAKLLERNPTATEHVTPRRAKKSSPPRRRRKTAADLANTARKLGFNGVPQSRPALAAPSAMSATRPLNPQMQKLSASGTFPVNRRLQDMEERLQFEEENDDDGLKVAREKAATAAMARLLVKAGAVPHSVMIAIRKARVNKKIRSGTE